MTFADSILLEFHTSDAIMLYFVSRFSDSVTYGPIDLIMNTLQAMKACRGNALQALKCLALSCTRPDRDPCFAILCAVDYPLFSCIRSTVLDLLDDAV